MIWVWLVLGSAFCNALWTSAVKGRIREDGTVLFTASLRWGVGLLMLPLTWGQWHLFSTRWWLAGVVAGILESLGVWTLARGARKDYYTAYALSNVTPFFAVLLSFWLLGEAVTPGLALGVVFVVAGTLWLYWTGQWSWWGLLSALVGAASGIASKWVIAESGFAPHACFSFLAGALFMTVMGGFRVRWKNFGLTGAMRRNIVPIFGSFLATIGFYAALALAPFNQVSPLYRFNMVVGFLLSVYVLKERERLAARVTGALLILGGVVLVVWRP